MKEPIRFSGAPWYEEMPKMSCTIVGLGATGSFASLFLGRLGIQKFNLVDPDRIEDHNLGSQLFSVNDMGARKVSAAADLLMMYTNPIDVRTNGVLIENLEEHSSTSRNHLVTSNIVLATLDSMAGRKWLFEDFIANNTAPNAIFFDSRIGAELFEVYAIPKGDTEKITRYKETLFSDEEGNSGACNFQQSSHSAAGAAIQIAELITQWAVNIITDETDLPFKITKNIRINDYGVSY